MEKERAEYLILGYCRGSLNSAELEEMDGFLRNADNRELFVTIFSEIPESAAEVIAFDERMMPLLQRTLSVDRPEKPIRKMHVLRAPWIRYAAAIVIIAGLAVFIRNLRPEDNKITGIQSTAPAQDILAPGSSNAVITLADGRQIVLDDANNGTLAQQGNVVVEKTSDGQISYTGSSDKILYNTLFNPRGSKVVNLMLSDGTRVWLNSESSLRYPTSFVGEERVVEITGEAYFEVTHRPKEAFIVRQLSNNAQIRVLGTDFNINAYDDEASMKVTLLNGSVDVLKGDRHNLLKPGEQAELEDDIVKVVKDVDIDEVMSWKNGRFQFGEKADIAVIMRQISRWYNIEVKYDGSVNQQFWGSISRNENVSTVLKMLEATGSVKFKIEGRIVTVMPSFSTKEK